MGMATTGEGDAFSDGVRELALELLEPAGRVDAGHTPSREL